MTVTDRVPDSAPLVARPRVGRLTAIFGPHIAFYGLWAVGAVVLSLLWLDTLGRVIAIGIFAQLSFYNMLLYVHLLRMSAFSGPYLAADENWVWLRVGGFRKPRVVVLPWAAIEHVELRKVSKGMFSVQHICLYAPSMVAQANADRGVARDTRAAMKATGTPFCVNIRQVHGDPATLEARLREYARTASRY
ncbi:hypothetical protein [Actinomadura sp. HBU206391]|uniref:hypothetical protein n=1 Tax=Actinomadura sp. HBU206391 TaxID=2731692 RepID=UPI00164FA27B|nr:hypothetical protein [Actinomadura sp. HBU206391]MBC6457126.1 hypothetical protein [Actinomadura sp. HBU206391]